MSPFHRLMAALSMVVIGVYATTQKGEGALPIIFGLFFAAILADAICDACKRRPQ